MPIMDTYIWFVMILRTHSCELVPVSAVRTKASSICHRGTCLTCLGDRSSTLRTSWLFVFSGLSDQLSSAPLNYFTDTSRSFDATRIAGFLKADTALDHDGKGFALVTRCSHAVRVEVCRCHARKTDLI